MRRALVLLAARRRAARSPPHLPARRTSAAGCRCACPSSARGCVATPARRSSSSSPARQRFIVARPRRGADEPRHRRRLRRHARQPGQSGDHDVAARPSSSAASAARRGAATFRPHIGCVPASGGGRRTPTAYHPFPPGQADGRHVVNFNVLQPGDAPYGARCAQERAARRARRMRSASPATRRRRRGGVGASVVDAADRRRPRPRRPCTLAKSRARRRAARPRVRAAMNFGHPLLLLTLLVDPARGLALYRSRQRRRMRYAVRYTNVDVLASVVAGGQAVAALDRGRASSCSRSRRSASRSSRPRVHTLVASDNATVVLVLDVSGSMQANDVKPTRLVAAQQRAAHVPRQGAAAPQGRPHPLRRRAAGRDAADDRPRARRARRSTSRTSSTASAAPRSATRSPPPSRSGSAPSACTGAR